MTVVVAASVVVVVVAWPVVSPTTVTVSPTAPMMSNEVVAATMSLRVGELLLSSPTTLLVPLMGGSLVEGDKVGAPLLACCPSSTMANTSCRAFLTS